MEKKAYLEVAKIINTHGVRGAVKLELWCDGPQTFKKIKKVFYEKASANHFDCAFTLCRLYCRENRAKAHRTAEYRHPHRRLDR